MHTSPLSLLFTFAVATAAAQTPAPPVPRPAPAPRRPAPATTLHLAPTPMMQWDFMPEPMAYAPLMAELDSHFSLAEPGWEAYEHSFDLAQEHLLTMASAVPFAFEFGDHFISFNIFPILLGPF